MADPLPPARERGAALLTVLLLVAVMSVVTATLLERLTIATRLTGNAGALDQVRAYTLSAEALAAARIGDLIAADPERTTLAGGWNDTSVPLPVAGGRGNARVTAGGPCLTLNSLDRQSVVKGKSVSVSVDFGGRRLLKKKQKTN